VYEFVRELVRNCSESGWV